MLFILLGVLRVGLDCAFGVCVFPFFFFFLHAFVRLRLLFIYYSMNSSCKVWLFYFFQPISAYRALFMDSQISLFSNFFIKNGSYGTIYTFKNYFATIFFSFQFQFSVFSYIQTNPKSKRSIEKCLQLELRIWYCVIYRHSRLLF